MQSGLIVINKEKNITSFGTLTKLQKILNQDKIGHIGTLDPNATGVLVCLINDSCKYSSNLANLDKIYEAELIFGFSTDSLDITGKVLKKTKFNKKNLKDLILNLDKTLKIFIGKRKQVPPMVSAKKKNGKKLYELARKNISIDRKPCNITIYDIEIIDNLKVKIYNQIPSLSCKIKVKCSSGTYIRSLCDDIGKKLNINSCMGDLNRISIGNFDIKDSYKLSKITSLVNENDFSFIKPCFYQKNETALSIGKFETIHLGHIEIINKLKYESEKKGLFPLIFTFDNNGYFITNEEKLSRLSLLDVKNIISIPFDKSIMNLSAEYFFNEIILNQLKSKLIVCGEDFCFGKNRKGDINYLKNMCKKHSIDLIVLNKKYYNLDKNYLINKNEKTENSIVISSSNIKNFVQSGNLTVANKMLDRCYSVIFKILDSNLLKLDNIYNKLLPKNGTYNVFYYKDKKSIDAKLVIKNDEIFLTNINDALSITDVKQIKIYFKDNEAN